MFLKKIVLENFRQFYGRQELEFSSGSGKNVTVIHGENGVGKTTLLNAILWCFYKIHTERFEHSENVLSHQAETEDIYDVKVEIAFEKDDKTYLVSRSFNQRTKEESLTAHEIFYGNHQQISPPQVFIDSIVPREMSKYFFFDGEYAESFASQKNKKHVREALEDMLGCQIAGQALKDLKSIQKEFEKKIGELSQNAQEKAVQQRIDDLEAKLTRIQEKRTQDQENLDSAKEAKDYLKRALREAQSTREVQRRREDLEKRLAEKQAAQRRTQQDWTAWIDEKGGSLLSRKLCEKTADTFKKAKLDGKIPSFIAETFVKDILHRKTCICHRPFEMGSAEERAIASLYEDAGNQIATDRMMAARSLSDQLAKTRETALTELDELRQRRQKWRQEISDIEADLTACRQQLKNSDIQELAEKEAALESREKDIEALIDALAADKVEQERLTADLKKKKDMRAKLLQNNSQAEELRKRSSLLEETADCIERELEQYREQSRRAILEDVNEILKVTARRDYVASLDESFSLDLLDATYHRSVARSGGENQLLSLAFIAALIRFSAQRMQDRSVILKPGTNAPLVLDSPFGQLDPTYQTATAEFLPRMAQQVILLLSRTQGNAEVLDMLRPHIGQEYFLVSENKSEQGDKTSDFTEINGQRVPMSRYGKDRTLTRILAA